MFNPAPIVACMMFRRNQEREERKEIIKREYEERGKLEKEEKRKYPFKNKIIEGKQIEIYPHYIIKMVKEYKTEENGQINILEEIYKTKEVLESYVLKDGNNIKII